MDHSQGVGAPQASDVPLEYRPLHKDLAARFADTVVLTFGQIEDLIGVTLPGDARASEEWWTNPAGRPPSPQSSSWILANRTASANLKAQTATFDRARP